MTQMPDPYNPPPQQQMYQSPPPPQQNQKVLAGVMGIVLGSLGIHRFILGDTTGGILRIVISLVTCGAGGIIGLIEGIIYLTKTDEQFYQEYVVQKKGWF